MNDFATLLLVMAVTVAVVLTWMWRDAERECRAQRRQAEELACWGELQIEEINALRQRLDAAERRHANLQQVYANLVRRRLAQSYPLIEHNLTRQRRRK